MKELEAIAVQYIPLHAERARLKDALKKVEKQLEPLEAALLRGIPEHKDPLYAGGFFFALKAGRTMTEIDPRALWHVLSNREMFFDVIKVLVTEARKYIPADLLAGVVTEKQSSPSIDLRPGPAPKVTLTPKVETKPEPKAKARGLSI